MILMIKLILIILFLVSKTKKKHAPAVTLSATDNQNLSKLFSKIFERSVYWNKYKTKSENENTRNEHKCFLESSFFGVNRLFILVYSKQHDPKRFKNRKYYLPQKV